MPLISVGFGVTVSMFTLLNVEGTPAVQLRELNQPLENAPVQLVWACVETVDAATSAIATSNVDGTNLQLTCARDVAPRRGLMENSRCGSRPISAPNQSAMPLIENGFPDLTETRARNCKGQAALANQKSHNRCPDCRNYGDGECGFVFLAADAVRPLNRQQCRPSWTSRGLIDQSFRFLLKLN